METTCLFLIIVTGGVILNTMVDSHPTRSILEGEVYSGSRSDSDSDSNYDSISESSSESDDANNDLTEHTGHEKYNVVKALDVDLDSDDYTPQELNLDELKNHPNYQEIKNLDKASLRAITMLARKKRSAKRNTLSTMLSYYSIETERPLILPDKSRGSGNKKDDMLYLNLFL